jgi:hypothetical protein
MQCPYCGAPLHPMRGRCAACGGKLRAEMLPEGHALVVHAGAPLRDRAGSPAAVLQTLSRGEVVELVGAQGTFLEVRLESGVTGFVDGVNVSAAPSRQAARSGSTAAAPVTRPPASDPEAEMDLPYGLPTLPGEELLYYGDFLYDPFKDRAFVVTSARLILGGGGNALPRVYELPNIATACMREGSNGMALGERTIVLEIANLASELYVAALRDPETALARLQDALRRTEAIVEPVPFASGGR